MSVVMMEFEAINRALFLMLNAPVGLSGASLAFAIAACNYSVLALAAILAFAGARGQPRDRAYLIYVALAAGLALGINYILGLAFPHPRPFMIGAGHTFLPHAPENSFPSDHATLMWTLTFGLLMRRSLRPVGWLAVILAALTSWARVFLGLHFPFDVLGSIAVAACALAILAPSRLWIVKSIMPLVARLHLAVPARIGHRSPS